MPDSYDDIKSIKTLLKDSNIYYMISVDLDGKFSYVNKLYAKNFKFIDGNLLGKPYYVTMHPDDMEICKEVGAKCFENPDKSFPATIRKHNGRNGYVITQWEYRLISRDGNIEGIFCIGHDITEIEEKKDSIKTLKGSLNRNKAVLKKLAYHQSHVVRAPVANILGLISVLKTMELDHNLKSIVAMLDESSLGLDKIVRETIKTIADSV